MMKNNVMRKNMPVFMLIMLLSLTLSGCWDVKFLDELSIVMAVGFDEGQNQDFLVTVQVVNPSEVSTGGGKGGGGGGKSAATTFSETGNTIFEALRKIANKTSRRLYFSHNQVLVIGEQLARKGVTPLFEFIERDPEVRTDFYVLVAKGAKASDVLKIATPIEKVPGTKIHESVENAEKSLGTSYGVTIKDIIERIDSDKKEIVSGSIEIVGDIKMGGSNQNVEKIDPMTTLKLNGMAVFKDERLTDFFDLLESRGLVWIHNKISNTVIDIPCNKAGHAAIEVIHSATSIKAQFQQQQPSIMIRVTQEANIGETLCPEMDVSNIEAFNQLSKATDEQIKKEILDAVNHAKKLKSDIFGFADIVYKANPAYWKKNKNNWDNIFSKIPVQVQVNTEIRREGLRNKSYFRKIRKE